ncbi:MAG: monovalent cation/H(+) antiporter subunit G [Planctomycetota bacterium]
MNALTDTIAALCLVFGLFFMFVGVIGVVRLPDTYLRLHAATKSTTLGLIGLLLAVAFHIGTGNVIAKVIATLVFALIAMPIGSHLLAKAAMRSGPRFWGQTIADEHGEDRVE